MFGAISKKKTMFGVFFLLRSLGFWRMYESGSMSEGEGKKKKVKSENALTFPIVACLLHVSHV